MLFVYLGRQTQTKQWKLIIDNVNNFVNGEILDQKIFKEVSIKNAQKGDLIKLIEEDVLNNIKKEHFKEKE